MRSDGMATRMAKYRQASLIPALPPEGEGLKLPLPPGEGRDEGGFTLIEAIVVMAIIGIIGAMVAVFIKRPVEGYVDAARRAELTDTADTALRRLGRDLRLALPNSVRTTSSAGVQYLEMLATRSGGRYRADKNSSGNGDPLDFTVADTSFDVLGPLSALPGQAIVPNQDLVVVYNLGIPGADAYNGDNRALITGTGPGSLTNENKISFAAGKLFPFASPGNRFQVVSGPVSYVCTPGGLDAQGNATGTLTRVWGYAVSPAQPTGAIGGTSALLARNVETCSFQYDPNVLNERNGLVAMQLRLTQGNESVSLYYEVHVSNVP